MHITTITTCKFSHTDLEQVKLKVLNWIQQFDTFCFLDSHHYPDKDSKACMAGAGTRRQFQSAAGKAIAGLQDFIDQQPAWLFGHIGYDIKNEIENLVSGHTDHIGFPDLNFFEPEILLMISDEVITITGPDPATTWQEISQTGIISSEPQGNIHIESRISRETYISILRKLKSHIHRGDCYEINFCQEFFARNTRIKASEVFLSLCRVSPNPFSAMYRLKDKWLLCASPERFLKRQGDKLISQPMKGTASRDAADPAHDAHQKQELFNSAKDRSENVMVVDLVRNDLSKICREGSVKVDELFGIYSFPQVHQMVSTVSGLIKPGKKFSDIIRACFPMGSMTGAPKKKVMELIEQYEMSKRGLFSGAMGYMEPGGDFDFNVVIRSLLYNETTGFLSFPAGSGITFYSEPEKEWEECVLKAAAIRKVLGG